MRFGIISSSGNVLEWFTSARQATTALAEIRQDPEADVDLLVFHDDGRPFDSLVWVEPQASPDFIPVAPAANGALAYTYSATIALTDGMPEALPATPANATDERDRSLIALR